MNPIHGHDPKVILQMIHFIYTNQLEEGSTCTANLLLIADMFNLKNLIKLCQKRLSKTLNVGNASEILTAADKVSDASSPKMAAMILSIKICLHLVAPKTGTIFCTQTSSCSTAS